MRINAGQRTIKYWKETYQTALGCANMIASCDAKKEK